MQTDERERLKIRNALRLGRALRFVWKSGPGWTAASAILIVVRGALPLFSLYLMKLVVDAVTAGMEAPDKRAAFGRVALFIGLMAAVALLGALCRSIAGLVREAQSQVVTDHMQDILHAKSIEVDLEYYENSQYYDTLHRAQREAPYRPTRIVNGLVQVGQSGISLLAMAGLLVSFHWFIAAIMFAAAVPGVLVRLRYSGKLYRWQRERTASERRAWYFSWMLTRDSHAKEIRLFDLGPLFMRRFRELRARLRRERLALAARRSAAELVTQASATVAVFGSYAFIAYRTVQGAITLGDLVMYFQAFQRGQGYLRQMLGGVAGLYEDNLFLSSLYDFLDLKRKVVEPAHPRPLPRPMKTGIVFDRVSFRYPGGARKVLEEVSLAVRPGEVVALVGENGSGKTTLIKLLCRLYDPTEGAITIDGIDLRRLDTTALRSEISVIFQDYAQYHLTARENIWFGNLGLAPGDERIAAAARDSGAEDVIEGLPRGYDTTLGKWFEDGEELSAGEWQKIALARAFVCDSRIIVLDEPTSSLDAKAEYELFQRSRRLVKDRAAIIISHRFSTVRMANSIYVLEKGRIVESGSHAELMRLGGRYARMFRMQAEPYR